MMQLQKKNTKFALVLSDNITICIGAHCKTIFLLMLKTKFQICIGVQGKTFVLVLPLMCVKLL